MSASVANSSSQTAILPSSSSTASSKTSYLNRCVEDLSQDKVASFERKATLWKIISVVSTVAFFALAIGAFIATSILAPISAPFVGIGAILLALPASQQVKKFLEWSQAAQNEAEKYKAIQRNYTDLNGRTPQQLGCLLSQMGIIWDRIPGMGIEHPENLSRLNPLLAQAQYLEKQTEYWTNLREEHANKARQLPNATDPEKKEKMIERHLALICEDEALNFKIQNAFVNAVLRKSDFCGTLENLGTLAKINYEERTLGNALDDPNANQIFTFNNRNLTPITFNDIKTMSVADLGQRIFAAMAA